MSWQECAQPEPSGTTDLRSMRRRLEETRESVLTDEPRCSPRHSALSPRLFIGESWQRSLAAHVDPDQQEPPLVCADGQLAERQAAHPLHTVIPLMRNLLANVADVTQHIMIVTDSDGTILWREGSPKVLAAADPVGLCEGTGWSEAAIGTNAMGTALAIDAPVQVYSAEHLVKRYHAWTCAAAPIHDPDAGRLIGAVDVSGTLAGMHPAMSSLVVATARLAELELRCAMTVRDDRMRERNGAHLSRLRGAAGALVSSSGRVLTAEPPGFWPERLPLSSDVDRLVLPDGREAVVEPLPEGYLVRAVGGPARPTRRAALSLSFLRSEGPVGVLNGRRLRLSLRHAELLAILALHPSGLTADQLALALYGEAGNATTVRAEMHRLRAHLGEDVLRTRPYRLHADLDADFVRVSQSLGHGDVRGAFAASDAPLLARSDAPAVRAERDQLAIALRSAVLERGDLEALWTYSRSDAGHDDVEVFERLVRATPPQDGRHAVARARLQWLLTSDC